MLVVPPRFTAILSRVRMSPDRLLTLHRLPLLLSLALGLCGCHAHPIAPSTSITPARSLTGVSSAVAQVQSSALYQQARKDCKRQDYRHAAELLATLSKTPGLAPEAVTFVQQQRTLCLNDAGVSTPVAPTIASLPARPPADADCGPRALLLLCQQLGVKTNMQTLRKTAGTTLAGLQQAALKLGLQAEGVQVSREALPDISPPAIAWDRRQHFIVVLALSGSGEQASATIHDPNKPRQ